LRCEIGQSFDRHWTREKKQVEISTFDRWIDIVATGASTMSQRNFRWVEANGGVEKLIDAAERRGVHLVRLTDDEGRELVAASKHAFVTLC
jgi:phosphoserine aminotransferase